MCDVRRATCDHTGQLGFVSPSCRAQGVVMPTSCHYVLIHYMIHVVLTASTLSMYTVATVDVTRRRVHVADSGTRRYAIR